MLKLQAQKTTEGAHDLGAALRLRRKERGLTMQVVAERSGLSVGFISQVERNLTSPSLSSLTSIASALESHITAFLEPPRKGKDISREALRQLYSLPGSAVSYERLSTKFPGSQLTAVVIHVPPGRREAPMRHRGEELYYVLDGELTVSVDGARTLLRRGDSIHFGSQRLHFTWNHTRWPTTLIICNTMDVFGEDEDLAEDAAD